MTSIEDLAGEIMKELMNYSEAVTENVKKAVDIVSAEVNDEIKSHITFEQRTGKYVKSFRTKTTSENKYGKSKTWYVANGEYRLSHLLENGHALRNGGRTQSFPHIKYGEELAIRRMQELTTEGIENAGR
ncbi:MAG: HK97 gp10 family phage protein [Anaerofustis sp.]